MPANVVLTVSRDLARLIQSHQPPFRKAPPKEFEISCSLLHFFIAQLQTSPFLTSLIDSSVMDQGDRPEQGWFQVGDSTAKSALNSKSSGVSCLCALCVLCG